MRPDLCARLPSVLALALAITAVVPARTLAAGQVCNNNNHKVNVSATSLAFGIYSPASPLPLLSNGTVQVSCANLNDILPTFTLALSPGGAGSFNPRKLSNGSARLNYNMYLDVNYTIIWGDGTSGTSTQNYSQSQNLGTIAYTDLGRIPASQIVATGAYTDTITVTVTF